MAAVAPVGGPTDGALAHYYDRWADDYEQNMLSWGYLVPAVTAWFIGALIEDRTTPILDAGAGTGLMGELLATLGYSRIIGIDISPKMLARARTKSVYRDLHEMELGRKLGFSTDAFSGTVATGVFAAGHAPPESLDELVRVTSAGAPIIFSVRTDVYETAFGAKQRALESDGKWERVDETCPFSALPLGHPELKVQVFAYRVR